MWKGEGGGANHLKSVENEESAEKQSGPHRETESGSLNRKGGEKGGKGDPGGRRREGLGNPSRGVPEKGVVREGKIFPSKHGKKKKKQKGTVITEEKNFLRGQITFRKWGGRERKKKK